MGRTAFPKTLAKSLGRDLADPAAFGSVPVANDRFQVIAEVLLEMWYDLRSGGSPCSTSMHLSLIAARQSTKIQRISQPQKLFGAPCSIHLKSWRRWESQWSPA
jgi:hypothetical protein